MSIRIHELAKKIGMDNKELLSLLKTRHFDVKSVSSTVDNISAEAIEQEFAPKAAPVSPPAAPAPAAATEAETKSMGGTAVATAPDSSHAFTTKVPLDAFVKTAEGVRREKEEAARAAALKTTVPPARPAPVAPLRPITPMRATETVSPPAIKFAPPPVPARPAPVSPISVPLSKSVSPPAPSAPMRSAPLAPPVAVPAAYTAPVVTQDGDVKIIHIKPPIIVRDFATALSLKPFKLISELMEMGIFAAMTQSLDETVAAKVAEKHGFLLEIKHRADAATQQAAKEKEKEKQTKPDTEDPANLVARPPIVCILGHVDHGKTSLLDAIRKAHVADGEAGGITQHIGAYQIEFNGRKITFLDTPGHAAFNKMRARGANVTDIAVLVVAADDGFMPQTDEALQHAQNAKVTLLVAVNKMDTKGANLDRVKAQMQERSIAPEDWGGETVTVPVSAVKGTGINDLLEMILLQADVLELKADPKGEIAGIIIESQVDVGRGPLATVIIQRGTLKIGDAIVCGPHWAKVRAMYDDQGLPIKVAPPSTPVRIIGWSGTPDSGAAFVGAKNAREAEKLAEEEEHRLKASSITDTPPKDISVEKLFANIAATQEKVLKVIVKTDVFGSAEAVRTILEGIKSTKISLEIVSTDVGLVTKNDVLMASAAGSIILGFNTKLENGVTPLAKHHGVRIETFGIIYELGDKVREMMADLLDPDLKETKTGAAEVRATFPLAKGFVAGCLVTEGKVNRNASARLRRGKETVYEGKVGTLKRFKDDASEVRAGLECGIKLDDFNGYQVGDVIECYEIQKIRAAL
ncbi:MAG TPA: translation initiation factor IF-2 [Opitutaceae bacterium]|jgi:translation initiation factor IF-2|nr:translation initiation factor IF-2 [Opitutaceae bacterium]